MGIWERKAKAGAIGGATGFMVGGAAWRYDLVGPHEPGGALSGVRYWFGAAFRPVAMASNDEPSLRSWMRAV